MSRSRRAGRSAAARNGPRRRRLAKDRAACRSGSGLPSATSASAASTNSRSRPSRPSRAPIARRDVPRRCRARPRPGHEPVVQQSELRQPTDHRIDHPRALRRVDAMMVAGAMHPAHQHAAQSLGGGGVALEIVQGGVFQVSVGHRCRGSPGPPIRLLARLLHQPPQISLCPSCRRRSVFDRRAGSARSTGSASGRCTAGKCSASTRSSARPWWRR